MSVKDPFEALVDEITLIRKDMERLQRTSLDREDAEAFNKKIVDYLNRLPEVVDMISENTDDQILKVHSDLTDRVSESHRRVLKETIHEAHNEYGKLAELLLSANQQVLRDAEKAHRAALGYFGGLLACWPQEPFWALWVCSGSKKILI